MIMNRNVVGDAVCVKKIVNERMRGNGNETSQEQKSGPIFWGVIHGVCVIVIVLFRCNEGLACVWYAKEGGREAPMLGWYLVPQRE